MPVLSQKKTRLTLSSAKMAGYWCWHALCLNRGECLKQRGVLEESESTPSDKQGTQRGNRSTRTERDADIQAQTKNYLNFMIMLPSRRNDQNWLPSLFNDFFSDEWPIAHAVANATPATNVLEDDKSYHVEIAAPGMTKNDFNIHVNDQDELVITMEKKEETPADEKKDCDKTEKKCDRKYLRHEFSYSRFEQSLLLPDNVDKDHISAKVTDGILHIDLPKLDPTVQKKPTRVIDIQ